TREVGPLAEDEVEPRLEGLVLGDDALSQLVVGRNRARLVLRERLQLLGGGVELVTAADQVDLRVGPVARGHDRPEEAKAVHPRGQKLHQPERDDRLAALRLHGGDVEVACCQGSDWSLRLTALVSPAMTLAGTSTAAYAELLEQNRRFLWNPFTQMKDYLAAEPVVIERGEGVKLADVNGVEYYDGNSSLWVNVHGHNRPELNDAIAAQLDKVAHSTLLGMANVPALELAERLVELTPSRLAEVFFSDSGATAVEIGLKVAFAYWRRVGRPEKKVFVAFDNGYHG